MAIGDIGTLGAGDTSETSVRRQLHAAVDHVVQIERTGTGRSIQVDSARRPRRGVRGWAVIEALLVGWGVVAGLDRVRVLVIIAALARSGAAGLLDGGSRLAGPVATVHEVHRLL